MLRSNTPVKVMVFGVFDGLHLGHRAFLNQAKRYGKELIVVVARNSAARKLKGRKPRESGKKRLAALRKVKGVSKAILGDRKQSSYAVIKRYKPDLICLGYDQKLLEKDLKKRMLLGGISRIRVIRLKAYRPEAFHTSKIRTNV